MSNAVVLASSTNLDANRLTAAVVAAGTETAIPVYAFLPRGSMPTAGTTRRGGVSRIEWVLFCTSDIVSGGASDTLRVRCRYGAVPGTADGELFASTCAFVIPMNAGAATQGFLIRLGIQTTTEPDDTTASLQLAVDASCVRSDSDAMTVSGSSSQVFIAHGATQVAPFNSDTYIWLTLTGTSTASGTSTFVDPRSILCTGYGLKLDS